jgi:hypothetical protein
MEAACRQLREEPLLRRLKRSAAPAQLFHPAPVGDHFLHLAGNFGVELFPARFEKVTTRGTDVFF